MTYRTIILGALLATTVVAATAQATMPQTTPAPTTPAPGDPAGPGNPLPYDRGYDKDSPRTEAIDASGRAGVQAANNDAAAQAPTPVSVQQSAQYSSDMAAYRQALHDRRHAINADRAAYAHQQRAYADAMYAWRLQVDACHRGNNRACNAPTPDPAAYW